MESFLNKKIISWCLFDFGNSAHSAIIATFIYSVFFARVLYGDEVQGSALWAQMTGIAALCTALISPFVGEYYDQKDGKKTGVMIFSFITIIATAALFMFEKGGNSAIYALIVAGISFFAIEIAVALNNSQLLDISTKENRGRISGYGWGIGYIGGLIALIISLVVFIGLDGMIEPILNLNSDTHENVRATTLFTAFWYLLFLIPLLIVFRTKIKGKTVPLKLVINNVKDTFKDLVTLEDKNLMLFLIASALYRDGLITLFAVGGLYAAGTFQMSFSEILIFAIGLNIMAGIGAFSFGFINDKIGSKKTIIISLIGLILVGIATLIITSKILFIALALFLGLFMGPCQSASRVFMSELSPEHEQAKYFGFYTLTGKSIAFTGPILFGILTSAFDSQRVGMLAVIILLSIGLATLLKVKK